MNEVKTFRAASMHEALAIVRRELGADAVILSTRQITHRRMLPFLRAREEVEITAGLAVNSRPAALSASTARRPPGSALRPTNANDGSEPATAVSKAAQIAAELERRHTDRQRLEQSLKSLESLTEGTPAPDDVAWIGTPFHTRPAIRTDEPASQEPSSASAQTRPQFSNVPSQAAKPLVNLPANHRGVKNATNAERRGTEHTPSAADQATHLAAAMDAASGPANSVNELVGRLDSLQKMVENLTRSAHFRGHDEVPPELFEIYTHLIDADIEDDLARELVFRLRQGCAAEQFQDASASRALLSAMVEADIRCTSPIRPANGRRRVVALVGPTGVGKTTTIAKLAANFRLRDGIKMGLVTVDTYRIAAVEQLRTYAEIIDLPMKVVTSPQEMRRALDELSGLDLVLIDTAGRSPRDELKIQELKTMLGDAHVDEVHLVVGLTASVRHIRLTAEQFQPVNPTAIVLTKLDEAAGMGCLLSVARQVNLPISYLTTGQDVPDDIEPANANRITRLVLGQDRLFD